MDIEQTIAREEEVMHLTREIRAERRRMMHQILYGDEITYDDLIDLLESVQADTERQIEEVKNLRGHIHRYDERDLCAHCGYDGRS